MRSKKPLLARLLLERAEATEARGYGGGESLGGVRAAADLAAAASGAADGGGGAIGWEALLRIDGCIGAHVETATETGWI